MLKELVNKQARHYSLHELFQIRDAIKILQGYGFRIIGSDEVMAELNSAIADYRDGGTK